MVELHDRQCLFELRVAHLGVRDAGVVGARFAELVAGDQLTAKSVEWDGARFTYRSWAVLAPTTGARVMLLFGNPTATSLDAGAMFAMESGGGSHRVWRALRSVGAIPPNAPIEAARLNDLVADNRSAVPGGLALASFASFPTPSSGPYAGMAGLRRLLGAAAFGNYLRWEGHRWARAWQESVARRPRTVIAFQKDAYEQVRQLESATLDLRRAPPTRQIFSERTKAMLRSAFFEVSKSGAQDLGVSG